MVEVSKGGVNYKLKPLFKIRQQMGTFHELRLRHNKFVSELPNFIKASIQDNEKPLLDLNREQLKTEHMTKMDKPITPPYSKSYAEAKGFKTPDLFASGDMQASLTLEVNKQSYTIMGHTEYTPKLLKKYGKDIFGIAISKQPKAKEITTKELAEWYKSEVFK